MKVARHQRRLADAGATAAFVVHDRPELVRDVLLAGVDCPFPVAVDPDRTAYRAWGLRRAPWVRVWLDPGVWRQYGRLLAAGERVRGLGRDPLQLGGDFVIDRRGRLVYSRPQRRDDRPPVGELLRAVEAAA